MSPIIKNRGKKFTLPSKYILFIITLLCIGVMAVSFTTDILSGTVGTVLGFITVPFQDGIGVAGSFLSARSDELTQIRDLINENARLRTQVDDLTGENTILQQEIYELNNLRQLYELDQVYSQYEKTGARIIGWEGGNWFHSFTINKGSRDGLEVDMNVMAGGGLVGRIVSVGYNYSKVTAIINDNSNVSSMVLSTSDNVIVSGNLELMRSSGVISFSQLVDDDNKVVPGDKVVTSNISDKFLPGILIGYVSTVSVDSNNLTRSGTITPAVDFRHLQEVLVVLRKKEDLVD